tara:strand:- start:5636 stop:5851 length:216 start_codon:yes stop_codon:yes gene_type:complete
MSQDIWPGMITAPIAGELVESFINGNINHVAKEIVAHPLPALLVLQVTVKLSKSEQGVLSRAIERAYDRSI